MFKSVNEVDKFRYDDCVITGVEIGDDYLHLKTEALIVKANNSQNSNYTDSYASETTISFTGATPVKAIKIGYKKYDANDKLIEAVEDKEIDLATADFRKLFKDMYLNDLVKAGDSCSICVTGMDDDPTVVCDSYELYLDCDEVSMSWEKYLNKVQY